MSDAPIAPPGLHLQWLEARVGAEALALLAQLPLLQLQAPRGHGEPVLVLPGFMADDRSTFLLRRFLGRIGYRVEGWGRGRNDGRMLDHVPGTMRHVQVMAERSGQPVNLVGWSRGGTLAREVAREFGDRQGALIRQVITLGSPVRGGGAARSVGWLAERQTGMHLEQLQALMEARAGTPITVPITAIYSRSDGVVAWRASIDERSPDVAHVEVRGSHMGLGCNVEVFRELARRLAQPRPNDRTAPRSSAAPRVRRRDAD
ncbi:MAG: esterase [Pseudomonadales bacterium]|jgi:surfactin synthase thioesterase subunit|nr:esterase [Pseudomonadales bacterium]